LCISASLLSPKQTIYHPQTFYTYHHKQISEHRVHRADVSGSLKVLPRRIERIERRDATLRIFHFPWAEVQPNWFCLNWYRLHSLARGSRLMPNVPHTEIPWESPTSFRRARVSSLRYSIICESGDPLLHLYLVRLSHRQPFCICSIHVGIVSQIAWLHNNRLRRRSETGSGISWSFSDSQAEISRQSEFELINYYLSILIEITTGILIIIELLWYNEKDKHKMGKK